MSIVLKNKIFLRAILLLAGITFFMPVTGFALDEFSKQWVGINAQHTSKRNKLWHSFLFSQLRFVDQAHPWQSGLVEGGVGYQVADEHSVWVGYRWTGRNPYNNFFQENRLFQQILSQKQRNLNRFLIRSRLEEITAGNSSQVALRLRERIAIEHERALFSNAYLFVYEEVFFQLNRPAFMPDAFVGENRIFLGFNLRKSKTTWWEIGYLNQFQVRTVNQSQNQMSHILAVTYSFLT
jgi:hypothetical protein